MDTQFDLSNAAFSLFIPFNFPHAIFIEKFPNVFGKGQRVNILGYVGLQFL